MEAVPRVLIVEDNADLLSILEQLLMSEYEIRTAPSGEEGVALATSFLPDVVILDLQLPGMHGIDAGIEIKRRLSGVRILVLTAIAGQDEAAAILRTGCCDAYMSKPAPLDAIRAKVAELLETGTAAHP
jgi:DNA-binding response OmpR family regulator